MILGENNEKMSKARGNVVNPDDVVREYGADSLRLYEMFMGPLEQVKPWQSQRDAGRASLPRPRRGAWSRPIWAAPSTSDDEKLVHKTIQKVTQDIEALRFNTAVERHDDLHAPPGGSDAGAARGGARARAAALAVRAAPRRGALAAPGACESLAYEPWPVWDEALCRDEVIEIAVQVNGKVRGRITLAPTAPEDEARQVAEADANVAAHLAGKSLYKMLYVPGRSSTSWCGEGRDGGAPLVLGSSRCGAAELVRVPPPVIAAHGATNGFVSLPRLLDRRRQRRRRGRSGGSSWASKRGSSSRRGMLSARGGRGLAARRGERRGGRDRGGHAAGPWNAGGSRRACLDRADRGRRERARYGRPSCARGDRSRERRKYRSVTRRRRLACCGAALGRAFGPSASWRTRRARRRHVTIR